MYGVVLNNTEDWLDPTAAYDSGVHAWEMGGEAEFYVQALDRSTLAELGVELYNPADFGGTANWIGQNYGNHIKHLDPSFNYTDAEWTAELGRLGLYGGDHVATPLRAGDLVEIRARYGLNYGGKRNINENHEIDSAYDFEIVVLARGFGLPDAAELVLADLKNTGNEFLFDETRQTGGERYQSTLVKLTDLLVEDVQTWASDTDILVSDGLGRDFTLHLCLNDSFNTMTPIVPGEIFDATGILDQSSSTGRDGYQLLVMNAEDIQLHSLDETVPEPVCLGVLGLLAGTWGVRRRWRMRRV